MSFFERKQNTHTQQQQPQLITDNYLIIFEFLPFRKQVALRRVSRRWKNLIEKVYHLPKFLLGLGFEVHPLALPPEISLSPIVHGPFCPGPGRPSELVCCDGKKLYRVGRGPTVLHAYPMAESSLGAQFSYQQWHCGSGSGSASYLNIDTGEITSPPNRFASLQHPWELHVEDEKLFLTNVVSAIRKQLSISMSVLDADPNAQYIYENRWFVLILQHRIYEELANVDVFDLDHFQNGTNEPLDPVLALFDVGSCMLHFGTPYFTDFSQFLVRNITNGNQISIPALSKCEYIHTVYRDFLFMIEGDSHDLCIYHLEQGDLVRRYKTSLNHLSYDCVIVFDGEAIIVGERGGGAAGRSGDVPEVALYQIIFK